MQRQFRVPARSRATWPGRAAQLAVCAVIMAGCESVSDTDAVSADEAELAETLALVADADADADADAGADASAAVAVLQLLGGPSADDATSYPQAINAAGDVVVGYTDRGGDERAFKYSSEAGFVLLPGPSGRALAVSDDGSLVVGRANTPGQPGGRAAILWHGTAEHELLVGTETDESGAPLYTMVDAAAVLDDGTVFGTCVKNDDAGTGLRCRYVAGELTMLGTGNVYAAGAEHYVGASRPVAAPQYASPSWDGEDTGFAPGADCAAEGSCFGALKALARGAESAVGEMTVPGLDGARVTTAFVYSPAGGVVVLPDLPGGSDACGATSVSDDGRVVGGHAAGSHGAGAAALWIDGQPVDLVDYIAERGAVVPADFQLGWVTGLSRDGRVIVGVGVHAPSEVYEGFRLTLPAAP